MIAEIVAVACLALALVSAYQLGRVTATWRLLIVLRRMNDRPTVTGWSELDGYQHAIGEILNDPHLFHEVRHDPR